MLLLVAVIFLGGSVLTAADPVAETSLHVTELTRGCKPRVAFGINFQNEDATHTAVLTLSTRSLIPERLLVTSNATDLRLPCLYHGVDSVTKESIFAHEMSGVLRSTFKSRGRWYRVRRSVDSTAPVNAVPIVLSEDAPPPASLLTDSASLHASAGANTFFGHSRSKRSLKLESFNDADARKVMEIVVVAESGYVSKFGGQAAAAARIMEMTNYVNGVYQAFGLRIVLVKIVTLTANPFDVSQSYELLLRDFSVWKILNVNGVRYDAAILLLSAPIKYVIAPGLTGTVIVAGWNNGLCHMFDSSTMVSDVGETIFAAWLTAQGIGGLLGLPYLEDVSGCTCPTLNGCVMSYSLTPENSNRLLNWSSCAVDRWRSQADAIWRSCLKDAPDASVPYTTTTHCGNGIIDSGEQCDCGPTLTCKSSCCDPSTCMFRAGAECASGACCNSSSCRLKPRGQACRDSDGPCDVAETCDGSSEWCPADDKVADGVSCVAGSSYCYNGECKSSTGQCQTLYDTSASVADAVCFNTLNTVNVGFCQKTLINVNATNRQYSIVRCTTADAMCGLLHCKLPVKPLVGDTYTLGTSSCSNQWGIDMSTSGLRSPAMVPDGAACGSDSMCVNSSCQPVSRFTCPDCPDCHGNGVLTRTKLCYCKPGFAPPDCSSAGCGGSVTSPIPCNVTTMAYSSASTTASTTAIKTASSIPTTIASSTASTVVCTTALKTAASIATTPPSTSGPAVVSKTTTAASTTSSRTASLTESTTASIRSVNTLTTTSAEDPFSSTTARTLKSTPVMSIEVPAFSTLTILLVTLIPLLAIALIASALILIFRKRCQPEASDSTKRKALKFGTKDPGIYAVANTAGSWSPEEDEYENPYDITTS